MQYLLQEKQKKENSIKISNKKIKKIKKRNKPLKMIVSLLMLDKMQHMKKFKQKKEEFYKSKRMKNLYQKLKEQLTLDITLKMLGKDKIISYL